MPVIVIVADREPMSVRVSISGSTLSPTVPGTRQHHRSGRMLGTSKMDTTVNDLALLAIDRLAQ